MALLSNVTLQVVVPAGLSLSFDGEPAPQARAMGAGFVVVLSEIAPHKTATLLIGLQCLSVAACTVAQIQAQAVLPGAPALPFAVPINTGDLLRPLSITTQQYGEYWKQLGNEVKFNVQSSVRSCPEFMTRVRELNLFPVQTIGIENIVAGRLLSASPVPIIVLVHVRLTAAATSSSLDFIIHSSAAELTSGIGKHLATIFRASTPTPGAWGL